MESIVDLRWNRLKVSLLNTRLIPHAKAHIFSIVDAILKDVSKNAGDSAEMPGLFFHLPGRSHTAKLSRSALINVEILFVRNERARIEAWKAALAAYLADSETGKNFSLSEMGEIEDRSYKLLAAETGSVQNEGELCLEFFSPLPFKPEKEKRRSYIGQRSFIELFEKRFSKLFGSEIVYSPEEDRFTILPYYWNYTEIKHASVSQAGNTKYINGCAGKLYIKGVFRRFLPFLILGSELHAGTKFSNSQGYYRLAAESPGYFERSFPDTRALLSVARDVISRYDHAAESLAAEEGFPFDEERFAQTLCTSIQNGTYTPSPNTAFLIKKKDGTDRMVEQPRFKDLIVEEYLLQLFSVIAERIFEEESIGFRKGISRRAAIDMVRQGMAEGFRFVIETDVEDFFSSIDPGILRRLLALYIPERDSLFRNLLLSCTTNGYILMGSYYERTKGVAQGNPLSPLLANLYLDSFDEAVHQWGVKLIRYADDLIIMTKTEQEAESCLSDVETTLSEIKLRLKKEKTSIKPVHEGFRFLGITFHGDEIEEHPEDELRLLKKPLYVIEPFVFLSVNGEAIEIKRGKEVVETLPFRNISEIILMEKCSFSTLLLTRCAERELPVTILLNSGYHATTIKPDTKSYYDRSSLHSRTYSSLSETELLSIAKEFAACKVKNYLSLFMMRYRQGTNHLLKELDEYANRIYSARDINTVRGLEGAAAKRVYRELNELLENNAFAMKRRTREKPDKLNSLLNFMYYLLFSRINATVRAEGLNPFLGFLHSPENTYESLVSDIVELFRSRADRCILRLVNLGIIKETDFVENERGWFLTHEGKTKFLEQLETEMNKKSGAEALSLKENI